MNKNDIVVKVNEFRESAKNPSANYQTISVLRELNWFVSVEDAESLEDGWRMSPGDNTAIDRACDKIIAKVKTPTKR